MGAETSWQWAGLLAAGAGAVGVGTAARAMFSPSSTLLGPVVSRGCADDPPRVALTFDDGPDERATPRILDILSEVGVRATFFVIGLNAERRGKLIDRMHREGHIIGNHSYHHDRLGLLRRGDYWRRELARADAAIQAATHAQPRFFRPPMGFRNIHIARVAREEGYITTTWTARALDGVHTSASRILNRLLRRAAAGCILALHDGHEPGHVRDLGPTIEALPKLIGRLRDQGLSLVRLDQLIGEVPYRPCPEGRQQ